MKLLNEKIDRMHFVRLGYDSYSESYIAIKQMGQMIGTIKFQRNCTISLIRTEVSIWNR